MSPAVGGGVIVGGTGAVSPGTPQTGSSLVPNAARLPRLHAAFANVLNGVSDSKVCIGPADSILSGSNGVAFGYGAAPIVAAVLRAAGIPAAVGLCVPTNPNSPIADTRIALGAGWNNNGALGQQSGFGGVGTAWEWTGVGSFVFTPNTGDTYDSYDVYYTGAAIFGTANVSAGAGAPTLINEGTAGNGIHKVTVSTAAAANLTCTITGVSGVGFINGVEPFNSTVRRVRVGNAAVGGCSTANWTSTAGAPNGPLDCLKAYAANAWIMELGGDDAFQGIPISTVFGLYSTLAAALKNSPADIIGMTVNPLAAGFLPPATVAAYMANLQNWCAANGAGFIDLLTAWGGPSAFNQIPNSSYYTDIIGHASLLGLADIGRVIGQTLLAA